MRILVCLALVAACGAASAPTSHYFDRPAGEVVAGGARMISITTPKGPAKVWVKRVGNNPRIKVLLLHGGPAMTHEYMEVFDSFFPGEGIEYYLYDQLGSFYSDQPKDDSLWEIPRFVDEVEQVRVALGLDKDNFYLLGHSWGGLLALEYALAHGDHLKGLVISNMMSSIPEYNKYAHDVLMPAMDPKALAEILALEKAEKYDDPHYMELLLPAFYTQHLLRMPLDKWPEPVMRAFGHLNKSIYIPMQGPSEMSARGKLGAWDRSKDLGQVRVPTLVIGGTHDTMDPKHMAWMAQQLPNARFLLCPEGSHMAMYDDQQIYFAGLIRFLRDVDRGAPLK